MKLIIVGGVASGATAATRARRLSEDADIVLFERGFYVSYANCGLPYYIGGEIEKRDDLFIASPERLRDRYRVDVRTSQEVVEIERNKKEVKVKDHATEEEFRERYDKLVLSPGARPMRPPLRGVDSSKVFTLRDLPDSDSIMNYLDRNRVESAVVVGGGSIGMELVENLCRQGVAVTVIEKQDKVMPTLGFEMASLIHRHLRDQKVHLCLGDGVQSFHETNGRLVVSTEKGVDIETDMLCLPSACGLRRSLLRRQALP